MTRRELALERAQAFVKRLDAPDTLVRPASFTEGHRFVELLVDEFEQLLRQADDRAEAVAVAQWYEDLVALLLAMPGPVGVGGPRWTAQLGERARAAVSQAVLTVQRAEQQSDSQGRDGSPAGSHVLPPV